MKAPDKIFIPRNIGIVSLAMLINNENPDDIVYIRKDLLLEWARKQLEDNVGQYHTDYDKALFSLIDKLKSL